MNTRLYVVRFSMTTTFTIGMITRLAPDNWHGFTHPRHALDNAREDFPDLTPVEEDIILCFLWFLFHLIPKEASRIVRNLR